MSSMMKDLTARGHELQEGLQEGLQDFFSHQEVNVGQAERVASAGLGGILMVMGLSRGSIGGVAAALLGGGLLYRAATGHCQAYKSFGINTADD